MVDIVGWYYYVVEWRLLLLLLLLLLTLWIRSLAKLPSQGKQY